jgi:hypothetical protein
MIEKYFNVIMPMGSDDDASKKQDLIQQAAQSHGLIAHLPKYNSSESSFDIHSALEDLKRSLFIIADLSLERPSCYYELGIAEALEKKIYLIAHVGTTIHQTVNRKDVRFYRDMNHLQILMTDVIRNASLRKNAT